MTDNEIVKALECCLTNNCDKCAIYKECHNETGKGRVQIVIDLINRQKAEIERLQNENNQFADISKMYSEIKSEVIKEFAEMLKGKATTPIGTLYGEMIHIDDIDNLVKEMKEENNAKEI